MSLAFGSLIAFIVALGALVIVHEFGHYWVARRLGVKVLRFSIGFGKPLLRWRGKDNSTEYVVAAIPLGGYVKMLDEREGPVSPQERHLAFNNKSIWARIAIVCAGPFANVIMAILVYTVVYSMGITGIKPIVGDIQKESVAEIAGFKSKDLIIAVAGKPVGTWQQVRLETLDALMSHDNFTIRVKTADDIEEDRFLRVRDAGLLKSEGDIIDNLGLLPWWPTIEPVIGEVIENGSADRAGLKAGDRLLKGNDKLIESWRDWVEIIQNSPGQEVKLLVLRQHNEIEIFIIPDKVEVEGQTIGRVNARPAASSSDEIQDLQILVRFSIPVSFIKALEETYSMSALTFKMIGELVTGRASVRNISGPISIAEYAGRSASIGLQYYLNFIAFISISLAVLNLLPIPLLDGGHLLYYLVELVKGSPVSESVEAIGQRIGIALLACLMTLALFNDITRLLS
ncbi:MAG: RIP metalloprotease RseP [Gammaproteobacteria bacterium]|nr:RIP metalloprotease RseP [Gammaproteobacteria bacterium]